MPGRDSEVHSAPWAAKRGPWERVKSGVGRRQENSDGEDILVRGNGTTRRNDAIATYGTVQISALTIKSIECISIENMSSAVIY